MAHPQAYSPEPGYKYQILARNLSYGRAYDHCDYAKDRQEKTFLLAEYRMAYGPGWQFKVILLPAKFWPAKIAHATPIGLIASTFPKYLIGG